MRRESGQATVEWVALILVAALVLGAAAVAAAGGEDPELGALVARRIARAPEAIATPEAVATPEAIAPGGGEGRSLDRAPPLAPRVPAAAPAPAPRAPAPTSPSQAADAFRRLRGLGAVAKRSWVVCLGYRRWRHEVAHPLLPTESFPLDEALAMANTCLNPYSFLTED